MFLASSPGMLMLVLGPHFEKHPQFNLLEPHPVTPSGAMPREDARARGLVAHAWWGRGDPALDSVPSSTHSGLPNRATLVCPTPGFLLELSWPRSPPTRVRVSFPTSALRLPQPVLFPPLLPPGVAGMTLNSTILRPWPLPRWPSPAFSCTEWKCFRGDP